MESRLIYKTTNFLLGKVKWRRGDQQEWKHFGRGAELNTALIQSEITMTFPCKEVVLVHRRTNSGKIGKDNLWNRIAQMLGNESFYLWDVELKKVIEFNRIGVMRVGEVESH